MRNIRVIIIEKLIEELSEFKALKKACRVLPASNEDKSRLIKTLKAIRDRKTIDLDIQDKLASLGIKVQVSEAPKVKDIPEDFEFDRYEELSKILTAIEIALVELDISKEELADRMGKSKASILRIFTGSTKLSLDLILDISKALHRRITFKL
jgi:transcriptional regulator with XRE-family HTH domain